MTDVRIGVDIGGTKIAAAVVADRGKVVGEVLRAPTPRGGEAVLDLVAVLVGRLSTSPGARPLVGVASAGVIDADGVVRSAAATMREWQGTAVRAGLEGRLRTSVDVINDVHAVALAEARFGAGRGFRRVLAVAVGTGIGGGLAVDGCVERGATGLAASVGHVVVPDATGEPCTCGAHSHAEALASGPALERYYARRVGSPPIPLREVVRRSGLGDADADATIAFGGMILGQALASAANLIDPDVIVIGGGVAEIGESFIGPARHAFAAGVMPSARTTTIVPAPLGVMAPLVGAACLHPLHLS